METTGNIARASLATLLFIGAWGANSQCPRSRNQGAGRGRCSTEARIRARQLLPSETSAIRRAALAGDHPVVSAKKLIDFYGPCNQNPLGKDQFTDAEDWKTLIGVSK